MGKQHPAFFPAANQAFTLRSRKSCTGDRTEDGLPLVSAESVTSAHLNECTQVAAQAHRVHRGLHRHGLVNDWHVAGVARGDGAGGAARGGTSTWWPSDGGDLPEGCFRGPGVHFR